jgi:hypothetical protein
VALGRMDEAQGEVERALTLKPDWSLGSLAGTGVNKVVQFQRPTDGHGPREGTVSVSMFLVM